MRLLTAMMGLALCCVSNALGQGAVILPSQVLDLSDWKLTLPTGSSGSPTEILQPALSTFVDPNYFFVNAAGAGVVFTAPCGGVTTSGSSYPRSELRQMVNNGAAAASWSTTTGTNTMEIEEAITHTPVAKPQVIAGQVHNGVTKVVDCRLDGSTLFIENASGGTVVVLDSNYQLGTTFTIKFVCQNGGIGIYYNGRLITTYSVSTSGCYFKAGCYTQSNPSHGDLPTAYGQVVIYSLRLNSGGPVPLQADLAAACSTPSGLALGQNFTYQIAVTNLGPSTATNVVIRDALPQAVTFLSATGGGVNDNGVVTWPAIPTLPVGGSVNYSVAVSAPGGGTLTNVVASTADNLASTATNNTVTVVNTITNSSQITASFTANPAAGPAPLTVQFTDQSTGPIVSWNWSFGDGTTSTNRSPTHVYASAGTFLAQLTVTGGNSQIASVSQIISVTNAATLTAAFSANPASGAAPLTVQFTDQSTRPVVSWNWNFGDGATSTNRNPTHVYASAGTFLAQLTVTGGNSQTASVSRTISVTNAATVAAAFSANPASGAAPLTVQFTDQSTGPVVSWNWNFGDGVISTNRNPSHTYTSAGNFPAQLTVAGSSGQSNSITHNITVTNGIVSVTFGISAGALNFNPQTGLFEQLVAVTNTGSSMAAAVRLLVGGLRSGVQLYNASGTNGPGPYAQYNLPLNPGQALTFFLEFYVPDRGAFTDSFQAVRFHR